MQEKKIISTNRLEAFSDGVISIIITIMVFDLKLHEIPTSTTVLIELQFMLPKFISYMISFVMLAVMWINHHQLFHQIKHTDSKLLWLNLHLLFWMSIIPFSTNFIGANPLIWQSSFFYGIVFFLNAFAFMILRDYVVVNKLMHNTISRNSQKKGIQKNKFAMTLYLISSIASYISVYISFVIFLIVPLLYLNPEEIKHEDDDEFI